MRTATVRAPAQAGAYFDHTISCGKDCSAKIYYPLAWSGPSSSPVVLLPQFYVEGWAYGAGGSLIVGTLITNNGGYFGFPHAALWQGSSHTFTDLNPAGSCGSCSPGSNAYGTNGTYIAGSGGSPEHALLWKLGQLKTPVDLNPAGFAYSEAYAVSGKTQAGYAFSSTTNTNHAVLWHGTAASAVDLTPSTRVKRLRDRVGAPERGRLRHARRDDGDPRASVAWHRREHGRSPSRGIHRLVRSRGSRKRASRIRTHQRHGCAACVALERQREDRRRSPAVLAGDTFTSSEAYAIDAAGNILGSAYSTSTAAWHAVMWVPASHFGS